MGPVGLQTEVNFMRSENETDGPNGVILLHTRLADMFRRIAVDQTEHSIRVCLEGMFHLPHKTLRTRRTISQQLQALSRGNATTWSLDLKAQGHLPVRPTATPPTQ